MTVMEENVIPDFDLINDSQTSCWLFPKQDTTPIPVTTTLFIYLNNPTFKFSVE